MKIAILHEMLVKFGGAEGVVKTILDIFPDADLFTLIYDEKKIGKFFPKNKINPQVWKLKSQKVYELTKRQRLCLPFMSSSVEALDFSDYDLVIASSSGFAHGAITKPETKFVVYSHSPARYLWDWTNEYKKDIGWNRGLKGYLLNRMFLKLRTWDFIASSRADKILANSKNTARRIEKYYKRKTTILYPPIDTKRFGKDLAKTSFEKYFDKYYIIISALTEFKKIDLAIEAFNKMPEKNLLIIGNGDYKKVLEKKIKHKNIVLCGAKYDDELVFLVQNSLGLVFPGEEDFGMVPLEVMSAGKPVFAYKKGGLLETNIAGMTGEFFEEKDGSDFIKNFKIFDENIKTPKYDSDKIKNHAKKFGKEEFERTLKEAL